jgi:hypothetical protein
VKPARLSLVVLLLPCLLAVLPGVAEVVESMSPFGDCTESCPGDTADGKCSSNCDECTCCQRAMSAVIASSVPLGMPRSAETASAAIPASFPLGFAQGVFHPPRA